MLTLGQRIRTRREALNLSGYRLAKELGVARQSVAAWEQDRTVPRTTLLAPLASVLEISIDELLGEDVA